MVYTCQKCKEKQERAFIKFIKQMEKEMKKEELKINNTN